MDWKDCLKGKPWLRPFNRNGITDRLLEATGGNAFVVFNSLHQLFELHTLEAFQLSGDSVNVALSEDQLSGFLVHDFRANDIALHADELISMSRIAENDQARREATRAARIAESLRSIERALGTKI